MGELNGYKDIFDIAVGKAAESDYRNAIPNFREHPELFHFIMAPNYMRTPDGAALELAKELDFFLAEKIISRGPSKAGAIYETLDAVESRHMLMMTFLIKTIGSNWGYVLEIGGGYGNCLRLVHDLASYTKWTIWDLSYVLDLQRWFLGAECVDLTKVQFLPNTEPYAFEPTLVLGSHSLSEFSLDDFARYFLTIRRAKYLFYVSHNSSPSLILLSKKMALIKTVFSLVSQQVYENGASTMYIFKNKENS